MPMPNNLYVRSAFQFLHASGPRTEERLTDLVIHYCTIYGIAPAPYIQAALDHFRSAEYQRLWGGE